MLDTTPAEIPSKTPLLKQEYEAIRRAVHARSPKLIYPAISDYHAALRASNEQLSQETECHHVNGHDSAEYDRLIQSTECFTLLRALERPEEEIEGLRTLFDEASKIIVKVKAEEVNTLRLLQLSPEPEPTFLEKLGRIGAGIKRYFSETVGSFFRYLWDRIRACISTACSALCSFLGERREIEDRTSSQALVTPLVILSSGTTVPVLSGEESQSGIGKDLEATSGQDELGIR